MPISAPSRCISNRCRRRDGTRRSPMTAPRRRRCAPAMSTRPAPPPMSGQCVSCRPMSIPAWASRISAAPRGATRPCSDRDPSSLINIVLKRRPADRHQGYARRLSHAAVPHHLQRSRGRRRGDLHPQCLGQPQQCCDAGAGRGHTQEHRRVQRPSRRSQNAVTLTLASFPANTENLQLILQIGV